MKAVIQRVSKASVSVDGQVVSSIGNGLCVLIGIKRDDVAADVKYM
ncbi:PREDICTED: D-tyrosyl-tRNA(Tyr) deacylase-like isoform X6 [Vollenhovia emeryi]|nr:PREDICTED: D-tyrosyl-tRNA(Tyr) deacylase-like isoform X6 [Vollenhovia emeryi]